MTEPEVAEPTLEPEVTGEVEGSDPPAVDGEDETPS